MSLASFSEFLSPMRCFRIQVRRAALDNHLLFEDLWTHLMELKTQRGWIVSYILHNPKPRLLTRATIFLQLDKFACWNETKRELVF